MGLKEVYLQWEDKWYNFLDKVDSHLPVYKLVDRIDKVVPSFLLLIIIIVLVAGLFIAMPLFLEPGIQVTFSVVDTEGNFLSGIEVNYEVEGRTGSATTNENGEISIFVPANSSVEIRVSETTALGKEFEAFEKTFLAGETGFLGKVVLREKAPLFEERTILFQDASGQRITGKQIKIRLSCQNPLVTPSPQDVTDLDMDGKIAVKEPRDCSILQATVLEPTEFASESFVLNRGTQTIRLEAVEPARGTLRIRVKDNAGNIIVSSNFDVTISDQDGYKVGEKYTQSYGEVIFSDLVAGTYSVSVEDVGGNYAIASQPGIKVLENKTTETDIVVSKTIKAVLRVNVVDKDTGDAIEGAVVKLVNEEKETVAEKEAPNGEELVFHLTESGDYTLIASHEDYLYEILELKDVGDEEIEVELEEITELNSGRIEVQVQDEDDIPVKNARVKIRFLETGLLVPIEPEMTDSNGIASFVGVKEGSYYAYAEKFPAFGDNREAGRQIDIRDITMFKVRLVIGTSLVSVKGFDQDMLPVPEAEAEFFSETGESLGKIPLTDGTGEFELKADKMVYVKVEHPDYMAVYTIPQQLWPDQGVEFAAVMEPRLVFGRPEMQFEGMYDMAGSQTHELKSGNRYIAKFKLSVPEEGNFEKGGVHFRVGDGEALANEPLVVRQAFAGSITAPLKGTTYKEPAGYEEDSKNLTEGDAKWINIFWPKLGPGNYYFGFEVRVKDQVTPYTRLPMHYRAWLIDESGDYVRAPEDLELGLSESISGKQALYAKTFDLAFMEGQDAECQEDFCYSGESILDKDLGLYLYEPYTMRNGARHRLSFSVLNNSLKEYGNSELFVSVEGLTIDSYTIKDAQAQETSAENISVKKVEAINLGDFTRGKSVSGEFFFTPGQVGRASVEVKVVADGRVVFLKEIEATVVSENGMKIYTEPEILPTYVPTGLEVTVREVISEQEFELKDALVRVSILNADKTELFFSKRTNAFGVTNFSLPPALPNATVTIEAEKPGYYAEPRVLHVSSSVLRFSPEELEIGIDTRANQEHVFLSKVENTTGIDLEIENVELSGKFKGLLDQETMENFAQQQKGTAIKALENETLQMFKVELSENAADILLGREELEGEFTVTVLNRETGATWDIIVPLDVRISIGGLPENAPCLIVTKSDWDGVTLQNKATVEFEVKNHCMSGGSFVGLDNLQAKVVWESDDIGVVELSLTEAKSGASNSAVLRSLVWTPLFKDILPESTYYGMLTFTPKAGHIGETASFSVNIDAEIMTDSGPEMVGSSPNSLKSTVKVINLESCIRLPEDTLRIRSSMDQTALDIDSSECGNTPVDFALCLGDAGCKGGTKEGYIELSADKFTLNPDRSQKEILVSRGDLPGAYGIPVYAKLPGTSYRKVGEVVVEVEAERGSYWDLDKYTYSIVGIGTSDAGTLTNSMLEEEVQVTASVCDWGDAQKDNEYKPLLAAAGVGIGSKIGSELAGRAAAKMIAKAVVTKAVGDLSPEFVPIVAKEIAPALIDQGVKGGAEEAAKLAAEAMGEVGNQEIINTGVDAVSKGPAKMLDFTGPVVGGIVTYAITGDPIAAIASTVGGYIGMALCGPPCSIVGSIIGSIAASLFGSDPCDMDITEALPDFVINLGGSLREYHGQSIGPDAKDIQILGYEDDIEGLWNVIDRQVVEDEEKVGVVFTNLSGIEEVDPIYALAEMRATEHFHGNDTHQGAAVTIKNGGFAPYAVPDTYTGEHVQRFHLRFKTKNIQRTIPPVSYDSYECTQGTMIGRTGPGALPRIKLNWGWDDTTGIAYNSCDYDNEAYVYCDATQFSIELSKRIQAVEEFMKANNYSFDCPQNQALQLAKSRSASYNQKNGSSTIDANSLGLASMGLDYSSETLLVDVSVKNSSAVKQDGVVTVIVAGSSGSQFQETCTRAFTDLASGSSKTVQCSFSGVKADSSQYRISASLASSTAGKLDEDLLLSTLVAIDETVQSRCWLPSSTDYYNGIPSVSYYIDTANPSIGQFVTDQTIAWTQDIQSAQDLTEMTHFRAYLVQDGFGPDFREDFAEFYTSSSFFDAPYWFADNPDGRLASYFADSDAMTMGVRYTLDDQLPGPGIYQVDIGITYENGGWSLYDAYGKPNAEILVQFYKVKDPSPDSIFYYMPLDGYVGLDSVNGRQFYGTNYINIDKPVAIVADPELLTTTELIGSNSFTLLTTELEQDFKSINSVAADRGFLMDIFEQAPYNIKMDFSPNYATPVALKMTQPKSDEPFSAYYELRESGRPVETGSNLTFWDGMGQCLDYSGVPVAEAFDFSPDREANDTDPLSNWQFAYAMDWGKADYVGDVYLKSVFYTPVERLYSLKAVKPESLRFLTPNLNQQQSVELNGIVGMKYNSVSGLTSVDKLSDLFELVEDQFVCVTNSGTRTAFWWNPKTLYEKAGAYSSVREIEEGLVADQSCIGYGS